MKRYIRTKDNKFHDTTKERYLIDGERLVLAHEYETHPTMTNGNMVLSIYITEKHVEYINCGVIDKESDDILELVDDSDLAKLNELSIDCADSYYSYSIIDCNNIINIKVAKQIIYSECSYDSIDGLRNYIEALYTKQGDDYKLVWDKSRGII